MTFWYLATPYSKYPEGIEAAFRDACRQTALLIREKIPVYSPIAHTHPVAVNGDIDPLDHKIWLPADQPLMDAAIGLIVCKMETWEESYGIKHEIEAFQKAGKPVIYMTPNVVPELPKKARATAGAVCDRASRLVGGDRQRTHGDKVENHKNIAALWNAYLGWRLIEDNWLKPADVALMMALLKIARTKTGSHNLDDYVDLAGYAGVAAEIAERA